jgi:hypothetical protein
MNWYKMSPFQTSILPPRMHNKLTEHERHFMQNNPFPTKSHAELDNNFNVCSSHLKDGVDEWVNFKLSNL